MVLWSWWRSMRAAIITQSGSSSCWRTIISSRMSWRTVGKVRTSKSYTLRSDSGMPRTPVPEGFPKDVLKHEVRAATGVLGIPESDLKVYDFEVRTFPTVRQDILDEMIVLQQELGPDCVMMPALIDLHQDHKTIAEEGLRAFKRTTVLAYEIPWNNLNFAHQAYALS